MNLHLITECYHHKFGGLSRYEKTLIDGLKNKISFTFSHISALKKCNRLQQLCFLLSNNYYDKARKDDNTITHLLNQQLSLSLNFVPLQHVIVTVHDVAFLVQKYYHTLSFIDKLRYTLVIRGLRRAHWIITDAEFTKNEIIKYTSFPAHNIFVVPLGVDLSIFQRKKLTMTQKRAYTRNASGPVILYVGSEIARMNFSTLLRAFALIHKEYPKAKLLKVGEAKSFHDRQISLKLIKSLALDHAVEFVGYVSEKDLVYYYNAADIFVYPVEYTGYGLPALEAMACGCPVITTTSSTLPEVVSDAALLFEPHNVQQLKDHISFLLKNHPLRDTLRKKGLAHVKRYTWECCLSNTIKVYEQIKEKIRKTP